MIAPAIPAAAPRPTTCARAKARPPDASAISPIQRANPIAAWGEISSPGRVWNAAPVIHAMRAVTATTIAIPVRCADTFSTAIRRMPSGVVAMNSRLPRRASEASVPAIANTDHSATISASEAPVFQPIEPPRVSMFTGNGLPYTPDMTGGRLWTRLTSSCRDAAVLYASPKAAPLERNRAAIMPPMMITASRESRRVLA